MKFRVKVKIKISAMYFILQQSILLNCCLIVCIVVAKVKSSSFVTYPGKLFRIPDLSQYCYKKFYRKIIFLVRRHLKSNFIFLDEKLIRNTTLGLVFGEERINSLFQNETYFAFHGIPYASPPIGSLRFKAPRVADRYPTIYNASNSNHYKCCPQVNRSP